MKFCPANDSLAHPWMFGGISHCFIETIPLIIYSSLILVIGFPVIVIQYRSRRLQNERMQKSIFFCMQTTFMILMALLPTMRLIFQNMLLYDKVLYGYMVLSAIGNTISYKIALILFFQDRYGKSKNSIYGKHSMLLHAFWILTFINENLPFVALLTGDWWWKLKNTSDRVEFSLWVLRYVLTFSILILGLNAPALHKPGGSSGYHGIQGRIEELGIVEESTPSTWSKWSRKISLVYNSTWPKDSYLLQLNVLLCIGILVVGRVLNVYSPLTYKYVVDSLTINVKRNASHYESYSSTPFLESLLNPSKISFRNSANGLVFRWDLILVFVLLRLLQGSGMGSSGVLTALRTQLWIRVQQYSSRRISVHLFAHLHGLSLRWHLSKKTGEVLRIMDRGTDSLQNILNYILFNIAPTLIDIIIGIIYFATAFNGFFALIVFGTMTLYLVGTIAVTEWRTKYRRVMNQLDNAKNAKAVDSLINFETVKYYGAEAYEVKKYNDAITEFQNYEWLSLTTLNVLNSAQNLIINVGFLGGALLCAFYIANNETFTVGDFVLYCTYIVQLNAPLNFFGTYYRMIQQNFVDMENMFDLLEIDEEVKDSPNAQKIFIRRGEIEFKNVCFRYHKEKETLKDVSFKVPPGQTYALVGNSGGGKSTIIRLLFRFYDVDSGEILIDGQNINETSQSSLRQSIGVVPQDTVLFNQNIRENIRYGRLNATDAEVEEAAAAADIHERILSFPDKYDTMVGERGLKLSGGEKQRVAIARTLLKAPRIVLLDEATAALDTATERNIQASLNKVSADKTCLVVAHRLSTIVDADQILVLHDGVIRERGSHNELLALEDGLYAALWRQQLSGSEQKADETLVDL